ncbi:MAG TPA: mechanosensitive ion channel domain-containing protein [Bacteroidia bacterium]|jgi:small-conductance mechanosensitive channel
MDVEKAPKRFRSLRRIDLNKTERRQRIWIASYLLVFLCAGTAYLLLQLHVFEILGNYLSVAKKISLLVAVATLILMFARTIELIIYKRTKMAYMRYNLTRMVNLLSWMLVLAVSVAFLFKNWYSAAVSLGLVSLILGFALQNPIFSFISWIYILIRQPYRVGDRIQIAEFKGDVVEVNYLDTTLWEFSGDYLTNDIPSGRLIRFPNSLVMQSAVFNYSWEKFPYIWNEIPFHIAYQSDLEFVEKTIRKITMDEMGEKMAERIDDFKRIIHQTPVDELNVKEYPYISFRTNPNTWIEVSVTYLVEPKRAAMIRSRLIKKILAELNEHPDKTMFPKSDAR